MIIAVDFDGVLCEKRWPGIGAPNKKLIEHLAELRNQGHKVILWTCRTDDPFTDPQTQATRYLLTEAVDFCRSYGLTFDGVNEPDDESLELYGGNPRKIYANIYIDDNNAGEAFTAKYNIPYLNGSTYQEGII